MPRRGRRCCSPADRRRAKPGGASAASAVYHASLDPGGVPGVPVGERVRRGLVPAGGRGVDGPFGLAGAPRVTPAPPCRTKASPTAAGASRAWRPSSAQSRIALDEGCLHLRRHSGSTMFSRSDGSDMKPISSSTEGMSAARSTVKPASPRGRRCSRRPARRCPPPARRPAHRRAARSRPGQGPSARPPPRRRWPTGRCPAACRRGHAVRRAPRWPRPRPFRTACRPSRRARAPRPARRHGSR
jgi:hypothetical protein